MVFFFWYSERRKGSKRPTSFDVFTCACVAIQFQKILSEILEYGPFPGGHKQEEGDLCKLTRNVDKIWALLCMKQVLILHFQPSLSDIILNDIPICTGEASQNPPTLISTLF